MSERERWIVYPLLFFALGSALRDKLLQRLESKEIYCESLKIVDPENPTRILAELGSGKEISIDPSQAGGRVGVLTIQDSDGKEACQLAKDLRLSRVITNLLFVVDPVNQQPLVIAGTEQVPTMSVGGTNTVAGAAPFGSTGSTVSHHGVLMLNNQRVIPVRQPMQPRRSAPSSSKAPVPPSESPAPSPEAPAKESKSNDAAAE